MRRKRGGWWPRGRSQSLSTEWDWPNYSDKLKHLKRELDGLDYKGVFDPVFKLGWERNLGWAYIATDQNNQVTLDQVNDILSVQHLGSPHGTDLFNPVDPPDVPDIPLPPTSDPGSWKWVAEEGEKLRKEAEEKRIAFASIAANDKEMLSALRRGYDEGEPRFVELLSSLSIVRHYLPEALYRPSTTHYDATARVLLCDLEMPNYSSLAIVKKPRGRSYGWVPVSASEKKKAQEVILYSLCIRAGYLIAKSDLGDRYDTIAINARQQWFDSATGASREGIIASVQCQKRDLAELQFDHLDPKACFRHLKGIATPSTEQVTPVRPIFVLNTHDKRIVEGRDVASELEVETNLATMPWEDFEHLVRQLFEWEFGRDGVEVKVTQASRDRGVDAIMFDPDPLRGGKYVLQAKRYTRTVDVASVRDLYGTVVNEGANRGILVTTSSFGPDSYEFAKDKPISLIDGPNLTALLQRHGRKYRIDLVEARRLASAANNEN